MFISFSAELMFFFKLKFCFYFLILILYYYDNFLNLYNIENEYYFNKIIIIFQLLNV